MKLLERAKWVGRTVAAEVGHKLVRIGAGAQPVEPPRHLAHHAGLRYGWYQRNSHLPR